MAKGLMKVYNELPPWSKGVVSVVVVAGAALFTYSMYNSIKKKKEESNANEEAKKAKQEIEELRRKGISPSYSQSQYEGFAQRLTQAMDGCGTSENSVYSIFGSMKNKADVLSLINAFGVRYYSPCAATQPISYARFVLDSKSFGGGLSTWLEYDLTDSEISKINSILESKKIDYKF